MFKNFFFIKSFFCWNFVHFINYSCFNWAAFYNSAITMVNQPQLEAGYQTDTAKWRLCLKMVGQASPTIRCKFFVFYKFLQILRNVRGHNLVGLENGDMLLIGGKDNSSGAHQSKVWRLSSNLWTEEATLQKVFLKRSLWSKFINSSLQ